MADIIIQRTAAQIRDRLYTYMQTAVRRITGDTWDATDSDGAAINLEAMSDYMSDIRQEFNDAANDLLPSPESPYLPDMARLEGVTPLESETNAALWIRLQLARQEASLGSPDAIDQLVRLTFADVLDLGFDPQADGSIDIYIVSGAEPEGNALAGIPTAALRASIATGLNANDTHHLGTSFNVLAPTAQEFSILSTVVYDGSVRSDTNQLQEDVTAACRAFVRQARRLGRSVTETQVADAIQAVSGVQYASPTVLYTGALDSSPVANTILTPAADTIFYTCADVVNFVSGLGEATTGEVNIILQVV